MAVTNADQSASEFTQDAPAEGGEADAAKGEGPDTSASDAPVSEAAAEALNDSQPNAPPAFDAAEFLKNFDNHVRRAYSELRSAVGSLTAAANHLAIGPERILDLPFGDFPFRFRLPYVGTDRVMNLMLLTRDFPKAANLSSLAIRVPKGGVFVDAGGFVGTSAAFFSQILGADEIHVFEPQRIILPALEENLAMNGVKGLHLHQAALIDEAGPVAPGTFRAKEIGSTPFLKHKDGTYRGMALDDLGLDQINFIHLDFHGPKIFALQGAAKSIDKFRPFIAIDLEGRDLEEAKKFLEPYGYDVAGLPGCFLFYPRA